EEILIQNLIEEYASHVGHDLNQDGWKDIVSRSSKVAIFENGGTDISLSNPIVAMEEYVGTSIQPGDINGDGKVDLVVGDKDGRFTFIKNNTEAGEHFSNTSFEFVEHYGINETNYVAYSNVILNDLNGDGRPEVINNLESYS